MNSLASLSLPPLLALALALALAGGAGAAARVFLSHRIESFRRRRRTPATTFPLGTLLVNLLGAFLAGCLLGALPGVGLPPTELLESLRTPPAGLDAPGGAGSRDPGLFFWVVSVGFLGAFTTFSTWMLEGWERLTHPGTRREGVATLLLAAALGVAAALAGLLLAQALFPVQLP